MEWIRDPEKVRAGLEGSGFREWFGGEMEREAALRWFEPGEYLFRMGEDCPYLYYILRGQAKLYHPQPNGRMTLVDFFSAPCPVGEMELVEPQPMAGSVQAMTRCLCAALPAARCREPLLEDPRFLRRLCRFLCEKSILQGKTLARNQAYPLRERLAVFILRTSHNGLYTERHTEAADYMGVSYRYLLMTLARMVREGLLERVPSGFRIRDRSGLERLAAKLEE